MKSSLSTWWLEILRICCKNCTRKAPCKAKEPVFPSTYDSSNCCFLWQCIKGRILRSHSDKPAEKEAHSAISICRPLTTRFVSFDAKYCVRFMLLHSSQPQENMYSSQISNAVMASIFWQVASAIVWKARCRLEAGRQEWRVSAGNHRLWCRICGVDRHLGDVSQH